MKLASLTFAVTLIAAASFAQDADSRHRAKFGRNTPATEARIKAERESTAFRDAAKPQGNAVRTSEADGRHRAKFGRATPAEEARVKEERESTAFRDANADKTVPKRDWVDDFHRRKFGRPAPANDSK